MSQGVFAISLREMASGCECCTFATVSSSDLGRLGPCWSLPPTFAKSSPASRLSSSSSVLPSFDSASRPGTTSAGPRLVVERKSVDDLHKTIAAGRFWSQMRSAFAMRVAAPCLIIEGRTTSCAARSAPMRFAACVSRPPIWDRRHPHDDVTRHGPLAPSSCATAARSGAIRDRPPYSQRPRRPRMVPPPKPRSPPPREYPWSPRAHCSRASARFAKIVLGDPRRVAERRRESALHEPRHSAR